MPNPASRYSYESNLGKYRDSRNGRFVTQSKITSLLRRQTTVTQKEMRALSQQLADKKIDLSTWRDGMREKLRVIHTAQAAAAQGGFDRMDQVAWGRVGGKLRYQYERLDMFAKQIETQAQPLDGRFSQRVDMYAKSGFATFEETRRADMMDRGMEQERRVLGNAEHCTDCVDYAERGWQMIGTLPRIGDSACRTNCYCHFEYK